MRAAVFSPRMPELAKAMPSDTQSPHEMMSELQALEEMITDKCSVSAIDNSSVIGPEKLYFATKEQIEKVITKVINTHRKSTMEVTPTLERPEGKREFGTLSLNHKDNRKVLICWKARQNKTEAGPPTPQGVEWAFLH